MIPVLESFSNVVLPIFFDFGGGLGEPLEMLASILGKLSQGLA